MGASARTPSSSWRRSAPSRCRSPGGYSAEISPMVFDSMTRKSGPRDAALHSGHQLPCLIQLSEARNARLESFGTAGVEAQAEKRAVGGEPETERYPHCPKTIDQVCHRPRPFFGDPDCRKCPPPGARAL